MRTIIIAAMTRDRLIGREGKLPWHEPDDLAHFKRTTTGHAVIMGRRTYESIARPLPGRRNIVVTRNPQYTAAPGVDVVHSLEQALERCRARGEETAFVIGGAQIYAEALPLADEMILTEIPGECLAGDAYFPAFDRKDWQSLAPTKAGSLNVLHFQRAADRT